MFEKLLATIASEEFENCGRLKLHSFEAISDGLALHFTLSPGDETDDQQWRIRCEGVRDFALRAGFIDDLKIVTDHPVLLAFVEHTIALFFTCPAPNPFATVGALWERHRREVGDWVNFERFFNLSRNSLAVLLAASSGGLVATGPESLIQSYAQVLADHGVKTATLDRRPPTYWDGAQWLAPTLPLTALVFGPSYVVAARFDSTRL